MSEKQSIYQLGFDEHFQLDHSVEVTPARFTHLPEFPRKSLPDVRIPSIQPGRILREAEKQVKIISPGEAAHYLMEQVYTPFEAFEQEELHVLFLNSKNICTHRAMIYRGTVNSILVRPAEILREATRLGAPAIVISHNHPSGDATPSPEDIDLTRFTGQAAALLGIELLDHIILGSNQWVSLKQKGIKF